MVSSEIFKMLECVALNLVGGIFKNWLGLKSKIFGHISSLLSRDTEECIFSDPHFKSIKS